jgi:hypothetical protein
MSRKALLAVLFLVAAAGLAGLVLSSGDAAPEATGVADARSEPTMPLLKTQGRLSRSVVD